MDAVTVKVGSNLTMSCAVDALDLKYEVLRVSLQRQGDAQLPVVENGIVQSPFSGISRYSTQLDNRPGNGVSVKITLSDIQPEDAGVYVCHKQQERESSASLNITVLVPVTEIYIASIFPDGEESRVEDDGEVVLQQHDLYGVGCVATVEGSVIAPAVYVLIDGRDETASFQAVLQRDYSVLPSGLTVWNSRRRLTLTSVAPNPDFNEKQLRCIARQSGFPDVEATVQLFVQFAPKIRCSEERVVARTGTSATLECNIRANPGSRITWSSARGDLSSYPNVFFDETSVSSDETNLTLSIRNITQFNYQKYTLTAANIIDSTRATFELLEDPTVLAEKHQDAENAEGETTGPETLDAVLSEDVQIPDELPKPGDEQPPRGVTATTLQAQIDDYLPEIRNSSPGLEGGRGRKTEQQERVQDPENDRDHRGGAAVGSSSSLETRESLEEVDLPVQSAGVRHSHSSSSSSSSSKKEKKSDKSGGATTVPVLLLTISVVFWTTARLVGL